jgi:hypothetical protein
VVSYAELATLAGDRPTLYVDFPATWIYVIESTSILPGNWFTAASPVLRKVPMRRG